MKNSLEITVFDPDSVIENLEKSQQKKADLSLLKRMSRVLISVWEIPSILVKLSQGHSLVITANGDLFTGKVHTDKLKNLQARVAGKTEGSFDINAYVSSDTSMLENMNILRGKQHQSTPKFSATTKLWKDTTNPMAEVFMDAWEYQTKKHPENVEIFHEVSPQGHKYLCVKILGISSYGKFSEKTGKLMYMVSLQDGHEISL